MHDFLSPTDTPKLTHSDGLGSRKNEEIIATL